MIVEKRSVRGRTVLQVEGVIKLGESAQFFAEALQRALDEDEGNVFIDFSRINSIDSTGIGELVGYLGRFADLGRKLVLVDPSERMCRLLTISQLHTMFPRFDSLEEALAAEG